MLTYIIQLTLPHNIISKTWVARNVNIYMNVNVMYMTVKDCPGPVFEHKLYKL